MMKDLVYLYAEKSLNSKIFSAGLISQDMFDKVNEALSGEIDAIEHRLYTVPNTSLLRGMDDEITSNETAIGKR